MQYVIKSKIDVGAGAFRTRLLHQNPLDGSVGRCCLETLGFRRQRRCSANSTYTGTPDIGPGPRLFSTDFTPGRVFAAPSAAAASSAFSTTPQSRTLPSLTVTLTKTGSSLCSSSRIFISSSAELPVFGRAGFMMFNYGVGKPVQQVGAADNTREPAVAEHRDALDVMALQQFGDFIERHVFIHGDHVSCHHRASGAPCAFS